MNLKETREWCATAHGAQMYGRWKYSYHLRKCEQVALRFGFRDPILRKAAWAHDLLEDTSVTQEIMLAAGFESEVVLLAWAVQDEPGATRKERKAKTYLKIKATPRAVLIKLFDRIANVECADKIEMYRKEQAAFEESLFDPQDVEAAPLWAHLRSLLATNTK